MSMGEEARRRQPKPPAPPVLDRAAIEVWLQQVLPNAREFHRESLKAKTSRQKVNTANGIVSLRVVPVPVNNERGFERGVVRIGTGAFGRPWVLVHPRGRKEGGWKRLSGASILESAWRDTSHPRFDATPEQIREAFTATLADDIKRRRPRR